MPAAAVFLAGFLRGRLGSRPLERLGARLPGPGGPGGDDAPIPARLPGAGAADRRPRARRAGGGGVRPAPAQALPGGLEGLPRAVGARHWRSGGARAPSMRARARRLRGLCPALRRQPRRAVGLSRGPSRFLPPPARPLRALRRPTISDRTLMAGGG